MRILEIFSKLGIGGFYKEQITTGYHGARLTDIQIIGPFKTAAEAKDHSHKWKPPAFSSLTPENTEQRQENVKFFLFKPDNFEGELSSPVNLLIQKVECPVFSNSAHEQTSHPHKANPDNEPKI